VRRSVIMARKRNGAVTKRGRYGRDTAKQRREAVAQARKLGASAAAAKLGIPVSTLRSWCRQQRREAEASAQPAQAAQEAATGTEAEEREPARRRVAKRYTPSQRAEILEYAGRKGVTAAHRVVV